MIACLRFIEPQHIVGCCRAQEDLQERIVAHDVDEVELLHLLKVLERHVHVAALRTGVQRTVVEHDIRTHTALLQTLLASASEFEMLEEGPRRVVSAIAAFTPPCSLDESQNSCILDESRETTVSLAVRNRGRGHHDRCPLPPLRERYLAAIC